MDSPPIPKVSLRHPSLRKVAACKAAICLSISVQDVGLDIIRNPRNESGNDLGTYISSV